MRVEVFAVLSMRPESITLYVPTGANCRVRKMNTFVISHLTTFYCKKIGEKKKRLIIHFQTCLRKRFRILPILFHTFREILKENLNIIGYTFL